MTFIFTGNTIPAVTSYLLDQPTPSDIDATWTETELQISRQSTRNNLGSFLKVFSVADDQIESRINELFEFLDKVCGADLQSSHNEYKTIIIKHSKEILRLLLGSDTLKAILGLKHKRIRQLNELLFKLLAFTSSNASLDLTERILEVLYTERQNLNLSFDHLIDDFDFDHRDLRKSHTNNLKLIYATLGFKDSAENRIRISHFLENDMIYLFRRVYNNFYVSEEVNTSPDEQVSQNSALQRRLVSERAFVEIFHHEDIITMLFSKDQIRSIKSRLKVRSSKFIQEFILILIVVIGTRDFAHEPDAEKFIKDSVSALVTPQEYREN